MYNSINDGHIPIVDKDSFLGYTVLTDNDSQKPWLMSELGVEFLLSRSPTEELNMLNIKDINEFRSHVAHKEEIREMDIGENSSSFCYMIAAEGTFDDAWSRECRGIVFDKASGRVNGRPLHKFFNVGEREETRVENIDWSKVVRVMDKRDGSMIHSVWTDQGIRLKSKKSFDSDVAKAAQAWMDARPQVLSMVSDLSSNNCTAIFEWTAPDARIVLFYPDAELQLLHVRNNKTGEYMDGAMMRRLASTYGVKCVDEVDEFFEVMDFYKDGAWVGSTRVLDWKAMLEAAKTREGVEGWVVQFQNGDMVKLKTDWYLKRHRAMTFIRERDIAQLVLDEGLDDMKSLLVGEGVDITEILQIEARVLHDLRELMMTVDLAMEEDRCLDRKSFALKHKETKFFGLKMARFIGKEPNFKEYFERNLLKDRYGLRQLNLISSVAESE